MGPANGCRDAVQTVGLGELIVVRDSASRLVTHGLGSCIGVTLFDPVARVAGLLHYMLPRPPVHTAGSLELPLFGSFGVPELLRRAQALGAARERLVLCAAGGAAFQEDRVGFQVGAKNRTLLRRVLWQNNLPMAAADTGGGSARTLCLDAGQGTVFVRTQGRQTVLWCAPARVLSEEP